MAQPGQRIRRIFDSLHRQSTGSRSMATRVSRGCLALAAIGLVYAIHLGLDFRARNAVLADQGLQLARSIANDAEARIDAAFRNVAQSVDEAATDLSHSGAPNESALLARLRALLYANPDLIEAGIAFAPFAYDPQLRLYGLSYVVDAKGLQFRDLDVDQDYTRPGVDWYRRPLSGTPVWLETRYHETRQTNAVTYAAPVFEPGDAAQPVAVLYATYGVGQLQRVLTGMDLGDSGYSFLISNSQRFVLHPNRNYINSEFTLEDLLRRLDASTAASGIRSALEDHAQSAYFTDPATGIDSRIFFRGIETTGWTMGVVLADRDTRMPPDTANQKLIRLALLLGASTVLLTVPLSGVTRGSIRGVWTVSSVFAAGCLIISGFTLWLAQGQPSTDPRDSVRITNEHTLDRFISEQRRRTLSQREEVPLFVPTGIHIQSIAFETGDDAHVTGYLWQRYTDGIHDNVARGLVIPESRSFEIGEPYTAAVGDARLLRWNFKATLDRHFDYSRYPFGREYLRIQLWNKEFTGNVILIPDLQSYKLIDPAARPGLAGDLLLSGWNITDSLFSYQFRSYESSFGLADYSGLTDFPELFFNIGVEKQITGIFVSNLLPLMVVFILLFGVLFLATSDSGSKGLLGFTLDVVLACAAFFLVAIFSHIAMRNSVAARDIFYLEYYYFVTYAMILFVAMNYVHFTKTPTRLLRFRDNLVAKVIYWPGSMLAILVLTLLEFY